MSSYLINSNIEKEKKQQIKGNKRKNMKFFKNEDELLPTIITDLSGKILYLNEIAKKDLYPTAVGDSVLKFIRQDVVKKISMYGKMDIVIPENCGYERAIVKAAGEGITKTIEVTLFHAESDSIKNDERLYAGYGEIINTKHQKAVDLNELAEQIVSCMKDDLRFSYKDFEIVKAGNSPIIYANLTHLFTIAVGVIAVFNEIDYKAKVKIGIEKQSDDYILSLSLCKITLENINSLHHLSILYPNVASRLEYLANLCKDSNIKYSFSSKSDCIVAEFAVTNMLNEAGKLAQPLFTATEQDIIAYAMSVFIYNEVNGITEEEPE